MRKIIFIVIFILFLWVILAQTILFKNRWSDKKAHRVFESKNVSLVIYDTIINKRHLHYAVSGSDTLPTLVFLHGSPGSWMNYMKYMWDTSMQKKFKIVSIDRPGFGYSDFGQAMHLQDQCSIILPVLQSLKRKYAMYLCGHSMGGPIAIELATMDTSLFKTIIITSGSIDKNQEKTETWRKIMNVKPLYWTLPGAFGPSNTELLYLKNDLPFLQKEFEKVKCNVHFIHGDKDTWVPISNIAFGEMMLKNAKSIKIDTIFGAGHQIPWENKKEFTNILLSLY